MNRKHFLCAAALPAILCFGLIYAGQVIPATGPGDEASVILGQIQAMEAPILDISRQKDEAYMQSYLDVGKEWAQKREDLIKDFFTRFPAHPQALALRSERWLKMAQGGRGQEVIDETTPVLAQMANAKDHANILFLRATAYRKMGDLALAAATVEEFITSVPEDKRGGQLLVQMGASELDPQKQAVFFHRAIDRYGAGGIYQQMAADWLRQGEGIGKAFELNFTDAISGKEISVQKDFKGKVVVIDFWATWCGPCVEEIPKLQSLYAKYKDQGVEFIGVSLDKPEAEGGLKAVKDYVAKTGIAWPQYFQGNGAESAFSTGLSVNAIPCVFVVDKQGKLFAVNAGDKLEKLIPQLLAN